MVSYKELLFWLLLAIAAETLTIVSPSGMATSVSPAIYGVLLTTANPFLIVLVAELGISLRMPVLNNKRTYIWTTDIFITLFNFSVFALMYGIGVHVYLFLFSLIIENGNNLLKALIFFLTVFIIELVNIIFIYFYMSTAKMQSLSSFVKQFIELFPSSLAIFGLGFLLAFLTEPYGKEIVALLFIPLLLARYSFKLYFDSQKMGMDTIHALNDALKAKDEYTSGHASRVEEYAVMLARAYGYTNTEVETIRTAAVLHDIGKIGTPDAILNKHGKLTTEEYDIIKEHSTMGAKILGNVDSLKKVSQIIIHHHERYDGKGYPDNMKGDAIAIEASILMIADSFDAMTTDRPYRAALSREEAFEELIRNKETQFNPFLVDLFIDTLNGEEV